MQPTLLYDGECGFCRRWIDYWKGFTSKALQYQTYQSVQHDFPQIPVDQLKESVAFLSPSGEASFGAKAVFQALDVGDGRGFWYGCYRFLPGFSWASEKLYHWVAQRRGSLAGLLNFFWPKNPEKRQYQISRRVFLAGLGLIYAIAFASLASQILGLVGSQGILPAKPFLEYLALRLPSPYWNLPTLFWFHLSDFWLQGACYLGVLLGLVLVAGYGGPLVPTLLWLLYLSLFGIGQEFLGFQWDILLLETGFLAIFLTPLSFSRRAYSQTKPAILTLWLYRWLLFRLMFESGVVKLLSGDSSWRDLSALTYHYETQPLPNSISYYLHQLPDWFHREATLFMYGVELVIPWLIIAPQPIRTLVAIPLIVFQLLIVASGNYGFFNLLAILLALLLIADRYWPEFFKRNQIKTTANKNLQAGSWPKSLLVPLFIGILFLSWGPGSRRLNFLPNPPDWMQRVQERVAAFHWVNSYGLFAVMTKARPEILIEGSYDGNHWQAYELPYKPGPVNRRPPFLLGHMPRLDWQLWFAALQPPGRYPPWFKNLLARLLENSAVVTQLFEKNPFVDKAPLQVRATIAPYYFSTSKVKNLTGEWWIVGPSQAYSPVFEKSNRD